MFGSILTLHTGFMQTDPDKIRLVQALGGTKKDILCKVLSHIITPTRHSPTFTFILLIIKGIDDGINTLHKISFYLVMLNSLPKSALAPLLIVWLGNNMRTIIVAAVSVAVFGSILTLHTGFISFRTYFAMK